MTVPVTASTDPSAEKDRYTFSKVKNGMKCST